MRRIDADSLSERTAIEMLLLMSVSKELEDLPRRRARQAACHIVMALRNTAKTPRMSVMVVSVVRWCGLILGRGG